MSRIKSTGEILKKHREDKKLKQSEIAQKFGCTAQLVSKIERNERSLSTDILEKYLELFDLTLKEKEDISFYEDYRTTGIKTKLYIQELEQEVEELKKENGKEKKGREIIEVLKNLALKEYLD